MAFENEKWGPPTKHERYSRVADKGKFDENMEAVFGKRDPKDFQQGRKTHKTFVLKSQDELSRAAQD